MPAQSVRGDFPILERVIHLDSASRGPMPRVAIEAIVEAARGIYQTNDEKVRRRCRGAADECRTLGARLLRCSRDEIGLVFNTTHGINAIASGIRWRRGDSVVLPDIEYPANVIPWLRLEELGVEVKVAPTIDGELPQETLGRLIDERTKVVALSHVQFTNGYRYDLAEMSELAHRFGALLFVDAAQSLGAVDIDVGRTGIDALSSCGYKWLCGPSGTGIMYVKRNLIEGLCPAYVGFEGVNPHTFREMFDDLKCEEWRAALEYPLSLSANRFEFGEYSDILCLGFARSLKYIQEYGLSRIEGRSKALVDRLISRLQESRMDVLTPMDPKRRAGIVTFRPKGRRRGGLPAELARRGILVAPRYGGIRASCHFFNDRVDVDELLRQVNLLANG